MQERYSAATEARHDTVSVQRLKNRRTAHIGRGCGVPIVIHAQQSEARSVSKLCKVRSISFVIGGTDSDSLLDFGFQTEGASNVSNRERSIPSEGTHCLTLIS